MTSVSERVRKRRPRAIQLLPQLDVVEDLAVEGQKQRVFSVRHRLRAALDVDDGEHGCAPARRPRGRQRPSGRAAVAKRGDHPARASRRQPADRRGARCPLRRTSTFLPLARSVAHCHHGRDVSGARWASAAAADRSSTVVEAHHMSAEITRHGGAATIDFGDTVRITTAFGPTRVPSPI